MFSVIPNAFNMDANELVFFERQLEHVKARSYDVKYPELKAERLIPVSSDAGTGARTITYYQYDHVGMAQVVANYSKDFKRVDVTAKSFSAEVKSLGDAYGYSVQDIRSAIMAGLDLEQRRANAAKRAMIEALNNIAWNGDSANNLQGFLTNPNIPVGAVPADGAGALTTFASKSADQIIRDVEDLISDIITNSKQVESADTVLLPTSIFTLLKNTPRSTLSDTSILKWLRDNNPDINLWEPVNELETAGVGATKMMVAYRRDPEKLTLEIPQMFEQFPPQVKGLDYEVPCHMRTGGVIIYYPLSINMAYGI